ncbi:Tetratricopeptide repeat-containing protein [Octadecabacter temperatus]|uniref:Sulfotransferase domain protein n=2 Tax=Octadecabacter temperatus TaxID=1458307 RepID=A0A0K0Y3G1_9RHOB|nr:Sulfotransferase domain protein [Octadecabacter temperatus]SIN93716.1 Tetratricopeptide repeat-containing protein [Octadecabacter temperatus]
MSPASSITKEITALLKSGRATEAVRRIELMIQKAPREVGLWLLLAQVHGRGTRRYDLTLKAAQQAIKLAPKNHRGWLEAAQSLDRLERSREAKVHIEKARKLAPLDLEVRFSLAAILANLNEIEKARDILEKLLKRQPDFLQGQIQLGFLMVRAGDLEAAKNLAQTLWSQHPDNPSIYDLMGATGTWDADNPALKHLEESLIPEAREMNSPRLPTLMATLAKAKNDLKDYDGAITLWTNAKQVEGRAHNAERYGKFIDTLINGVSRATYLGNPGSSDETPVLIVGMPRSGSTLLSQILSAHPAIASVGESPALHQSVSSFGLREHDAQAQLRWLSSLKPEDRDAFASRYLARTKDENPKAKRVVDKRLHNFENLALFSAAFPRARILHSLRDPMDTCVSCYMQKLKIAHSYTGDLKQLGDYYGQYRRLMDHWEKVLPNPFMNVQYEEVVADTEERARQIIDFIGLKWDPACLAFQDNDTQVRTLSNWQVRQPIYTTSVERWRRYDEHLGPLKSALVPFYPNGLN